MSSHVTSLGMYKQTIGGIKALPFCGHCRHVWNLIGYKESDAVLVNENIINSFVFVCH
jgi:hypothetical protein